MQHFYVFCNSLSVLYHNSVKHRYLAGTYIFLRHWHCIVCNGVTTTTTPKIKKALQALCSWDNWNLHMFRTLSYSMERSSRWLQSLWSAPVIQKWSVFTTIFIGEITWTLSSVLDHGYVQECTDKAISIFRKPLKPTYIQGESSDNLRVDKA